ncbi:MAG: DNA-3-methyladenine glycosylase [bacterium]
MLNCKTIPGVKCFKKIDSEFFARDTLTVARGLLGTKLIYHECEGIIVETEAYKDDAASHAITKPRKGAMLKETYGQVYIFFIYGMYHCLNFTTEKEGIGAVLIRAVEPTSGIEIMKQRRKTEKLINLTNGPGKLFQAFGFQPALHGEVVGKTIQLEGYLDSNKWEIAASPRIGLSRAADLEWRFFIKGNKFVSK